MKKISFIFLFGLLTLSLSAQAPFPTQSDVDAFMKTKTLVVLEASMFSEYNIFIKKAVEENWNITPYEFIKQEEFEEKRTDSTCSFLVLTQTSFERDKASVYYNFLNLLLGADVKYLNELPEFCSLPLSYSKAEETTYAPKLGLMIRFLQERIKLIASNPDGKLLRNLTYYNINANKVRDKIFLVTENDLSTQVNTLDKIKAIYPHELKIVSEEEVEEAINSKAPNTVIIHKVGPLKSSKSGWSYKILFGTDDAKIYFYNHHTISAKNPDGLLEKDFRRLR